MSLPTFVDYVAQLKRLFELYEQAHPAPKRRGRRYDYKQVGMLVFFVMMSLRRIVHFKTQRRWLEQHPAMLEVFGFDKIPHRTTLSRRFKALYPLLQDFLAFVGEWTEPLEEDFQSGELFEDKSLFKAHGPVWHRKDQKQSRIPKGLRNLDTEASWSKSDYHGWVYGYGLHCTVTQAGFPRYVVVGTASMSESAVIDQKAEDIQSQQPASVIGDNAYGKMARILSWAKKRIVLLTPGANLGNSEKAVAYREFVKQPENQQLLKARKTTIEPLFDLVSKLLGLDNNHKQLPLKGLANVCTFLSLGTLLVQLAMIVNSIWGLPLREIGHMMAVFA